MLASLPASMLNQNRSDLGIPNRLNLDASCSRRRFATGAIVVIEAAGNLSLESVHINVKRAAGINQNGLPNGRIMSWLKPPNYL